MEKHLRSKFHNTYSELTRTLNDSFDENTLEIQCHICPEATTYNRVHAALF
jgi:hypothetical protein